MTTVLIAHPRDGKTERRCEARCHDAKGKKCTCICGGKNHGVGFEKALENTFDPAVWDWDHPGEFECVTIPFQLLLFHGDLK